MRLTLRTLLAYLDDTLEPAQAREIGLKVEENPAAQELIDRIKKVTRRRGLNTPPTGSEGSASDPNTVAEYLSDALTSEQIAQMEQTCLESDVHLAEVAACHQILTLVLTEQVRVPPTARQRMYRLVKGRESIPNRKPGATIPIGGVRPDEKTADPDDTETSLLLGLPAFSTDSPARRIGRAAAVAVLLLILAGAVWMAIPRAERLKPGEPVAVAVVPPPKQETPPAKSSVKDPGPTPKPVPMPEEAPKAPTPPVEPGTKELAPTTPPPRSDRLPVGRLEKSTAVVVRKSVGGDRWERVVAENPAIFGSDRVMALPGYKATLQLEGPVTVELWGNLPELFASPVLESSVVPSAPGEGFDADLTLHRGRIYLSTKRPGGAKVRVRFLKEVWDFALTDAKSEVAFEVIHALMPGEFSERPRTTIAVIVREGEAVLKVPYRPATTLGKGGEAFWDNKGGKAELQSKPPAGERFPPYWSKVIAPNDGPRAAATLEALLGFSQKLTDPLRVRATFDEALQMKEERPTPADVAAARVAVLAFAALGDFRGIADQIADPQRPLLRISALEGLHSALAYDEESAEKFTKLLVDNQRLTPQDAEFALRLLRGFSPTERSEERTFDALQNGLMSSSIMVRELAFQNLLSFLKPDEKVPEVLLRFDVAAPAEMRDPIVKMWKVRIEGMKQDLQKPVVELAPAPRPKK